MIFLCTIALLSYLNIVVTAQTTCPMECVKKLYEVKGSEITNEEIECESEECGQCQVKFSDSYGLCTKCEVFLNSETDASGTVIKEETTTYRCIESNFDDRTEDVVKSRITKIAHISEIETRDPVSGNLGVFPKYSEYQFCQDINSDWSNCVNTPYLNDQQNNYHNNITVSECRFGSGVYREKENSEQYIDKFQMREEPYNLQFIPFCCPNNCESCSVYVESISDITKNKQSYFILENLENYKIVDEINWDYEDIEQTEVVQLDPQDPTITKKYIIIDPLKFTKLMEEFQESLKKDIVCEGCPKNRELSEGKCPCETGMWEVPYQSECSVNNPQCFEDYFNENCCENEKCLTCDGKGKCLTCKNSDNELVGEAPGCECVQGSYQYNVVDKSGEAVKTGGCQLCPYGSFTFEKDTEVCAECPSGPFTCYGGFNMQITPGHWRNQAFTTEYEKCIDNNENCIGGSGGGNELCKKGHVGPLCETCDVSGSDPYIFNGNLKCIQCSKSLSQEPTIFGIIGFRLFCMYLAVGGTLFAIEDKVGFNSLKILFNTHAPTPDQNGILMKILLNYVFLIGAITVFQLDMPGGFRDFIESVSNPAKSLALAFDCTTVGSSMNNTYFRIYFQIIIILLELLLVSFVFFITKKVEKNKTSTKAFMCATCLYQLLTNSPYLISMIMESVACRTILGTKYLLANLTYECSDSDLNFYKFGIQLPLFLILGVIIYAILFKKLRNHYNKIPDELAKGGAKRQKHLQKQINRILSNRQNQKIQPSQYDDTSSVNSENAEAAGGNKQNQSTSQNNNTFLDVQQNPAQPLTATEKSKNKSGGTQGSQAKAHKKNENEVNNALKEEIHVLDQTDCLQKYAYLYIEYKNDVYFWEFYKIIVRVLITMILSFYYKDIYVKGVMVFIVLFIYGLATLKYMPYKQKPHTKLDLASTGIIAVSVLGCMFLKDNSYGYWDVIVIGVMGLLNFGFAALIFTRIVTTSIKKLVVEAKNSKEKRACILKQKQLENEIKILQAENEKVEKDSKQYTKNCNKIEELQREVNGLEYSYEVDEEGKEIEEDKDPFDVRLIGWLSVKLRFMYSLMGYPSQQTIDKVTDLSQRLKRWGVDVFVLGVLSGQISLQHEYDYEDYEEIEEKPYTAAYILSGRLTEEQEKDLIAENEIYFEQTSEWNSKILEQLVKLVSKRLKNLKFDAKYWDIDGEDENKTNNNNGPQVVVNGEQNLEQSHDNFLTAGEAGDRKVALSLLENIGNKELLRHFEAFKLFESHNKGIIRKNDLSMILKTLGQNISAKDLGVMIQEIDQDGNEQIDFCEFLALIALKKTNVKHHEILREMYQWFDLESDGQLGLKEMKSMLKKLLNETSIDDYIILELIQTFDQDRDFQISYGEFLRIVT